MKFLRFFPILYFIAAFSLFLPFSVLACGGFEAFPLTGQYSHSNNETSVFVWFREGKETFVVEPHFTGNASDFGVLLPFPSRPAVQKAPEHLFDQLATLGVSEKRDSYEIFSIAPSASLNSIGAAPKVVEYEKKDVGDYKATVLSADNSDVLKEWLTKNTYQYTENDLENFSYYIQKGNYYFVALKINLQKAKTNPDGTLTEGLHPIGFTFQTERPVIAHHISSSDMDPMDYNLYILSDTMYFVPGAHMQYSKGIGRRDINNISSLLPYDGVNQWLTRMKITLNPRLIQEDLYPKRALSPIIVSNEDENYVFDSEQVPANSGVVLYTGGINSYLAISNETNAKNIGVNLLLRARVISLVVLILLILVIFLLVKAIIKRRKFSTPQNKINFFYLYAIGIALADVVVTGLTYYAIAMASENIVVIGLTDFDFLVYLLALSPLSLFIVLPILEARKKGKKAILYLIMWEIIWISIFFLLIVRMFTGSFYLITGPVSIFIPYLWPF